MKLLTRGRVNDRGSAQDKQFIPVEVCGTREGLCPGCVGYAALEMGLKPDVWKYAVPKMV
jgi:hypothetical protein